MSRTSSEHDRRVAGRLAGKTALVVGAGSIGPGWGNGKATAVTFAREGAAVFCVDRDPAAAEETAKIITDEGGQAHAYAADATDERQSRDMVAACLELWGQIDILDNNVGIAEVGGVVDMQMSNWDRVMDVNVKAALLAMKHTIPHMASRGGGSIVNIASIAGTRWLGVSYAAYYASKAALLHLTRTSAVEYARHGVRVNAVSPGAMQTPMVEQDAGISGVDSANVEEMWAKRAALVPLGVGGEGWDVAWAALYLASDESRYVTGIDLVVDGGLSLKW
ncbi:SDR family NAD(P)-dependent oxidoreductase [Amycolatopsis pithecellobii]|uniref:Glucose 1-dehydrogenase n=1 Tax=Amycolatopsis pithecellobii TaxID=664692 RepID=A0A6N7YTL3_9PSEU|nr:glucose 1-dehydrogenase [Amycolatopsis pithecellobii]MTD55272.1 glucose 1-dehydrogenase [Amycolatopsis pithecellobii]